MVKPLRLPKATEQAVLDGVSVRPITAIRLSRSRVSWTASSGVTRALQSFAHLLQAAARLDPAA